MCHMTIFWKFCQISVWQTPVDSGGIGGAVYSPPQSHTLYFPGFASPACPIFTLIYNICDAAWDDAPQKETYDSASRFIR